MRQEDTFEGWKRKEAVKEVWGPANTPTRSGTGTRPRAGICLVWEVETAVVLRAELGREEGLSQLGRKG